MFNMWFDEHTSQGFITLNNVTEGQGNFCEPEKEKKSVLL
jgi:hypothetical protein